MACQMVRHLILLMDKLIARQMVRHLDRPKEILMARQMVVRNEGSSLAALC